MGACACYRTGSPIWNAAPRADGTSAIVPPWAAISARTMARPRPVPPRSRAVVKKGSKTRAALPGDTPGPSSSTRSDARAPSRAARIVTAMPWPPCWRAFSRRFERRLSRHLEGLVFRAALGAALAARRQPRRDAAEADGRRRLRLEAPRPRGLLPPVGPRGEVRGALRPAHLPHLRALRGPPAAARAPGAVPAGRLRDVPLLPDPARRLGAGGLRARLRRRHERDHRAGRRLCDQGPPQPAPGERHGRAARGPLRVPLRAPAARGLRAPARHRRPLRRPRHGHVGHARPRLVRGRAGRSADARRDAAAVSPRAARRVSAPPRSARAPADRRWRTARYGRGSGAGSRS